MLGKEFGGIILASRCISSVLACCNTEAKQFCFLPFFFFVKTKILFRFLLVSKNRYSCRSFIEAKWPNELLKSGEYLYSELYHFSLHHCHLLGGNCQHHSSSVFLQFIFNTATRIMLFEHVFSHFFGQNSPKFSYH